MRTVSKKYLKEHEMLEWFDVTREQLDKLRLEEGLPFCRVTKTVRKYPVKECEEWLASKMEILRG